MKVMDGFHRKSEAKAILKASSKTAPVFNPGIAVARGSLWENLSLLQGGRKTFACCIVSCVLSGRDQPMR